MATTPKKTASKPAATTTTPATAPTSKLAATPKPAPSTKPPSKPAKPQPADVCRLTVTIRGELYAARPIRSETADVARAWRLRKADGTTYVIADTIHGATCECGDYVFRHDGFDASGCKHIKSLRVLGLIDGEGEDAADWAMWTDHVAFTTR